MHALEVVGIVVAAGCPWIVGIVYYWRKLPKGDLVRTWGDHVRERSRVR